jgi:hypothetical protein
MVAAATRSGGLFPIRYTALVLCALGGALCLAAALLWQRWWWWLAAALLLALALVGWFDLRQTRHAILRNYPIIGHLRFLFESSGPRCQYFIESTTRPAFSAPSARWSTSAPRASPTAAPSAPSSTSAPGLRMGQPLAAAHHAGLARLPHLDRRRPASHTRAWRPAPSPTTPACSTSRP